MKTTPITAKCLQRSVLAVPPLCRNADLSLSKAENARLVAHLRAGGVSTHMWGGNANVYGIGHAEYPAFLDTVEAIAQGDEWALPSIGPDFGKALDQVAILSKRAFPTAMLLPMRGVADKAGVARGIAKIAEAYGKPLIVYYKDIGYMNPADLTALFRDGLLCALKYGVLTPDPAVDPELAAILKAVPNDLVISGSGELPVLAHARDFGLRAFTSGCVCVAPKLSMAILAAIHAGDFKRAAAIRETFLPAENIREKINPIRVLHAGVAAAGVAATGPVYPMLSDITDAGQLADIASAYKALLAANDRPLAVAAE